MTNIFVGNLAYQVTETELEAAFAQFGKVERVTVARDRGTGQPRGFAFVEMSDDAAARNAINSLDGCKMAGRALNVNEARPRRQRTRFGGLQNAARAPRRGDPQR